MSPTVYSLPSSLSQFLSEKFENESVKQIAAAIMNLSDFYIQESGSSSPWEIPHAEKAYLYYFYPLNLLRTLKVAANANFLNFFHDIDSLQDFGSGLGSASHGLSHWNFKIENFERSAKAIELHKELSKLLPNQAQVSWTQTDKFPDTKDKLHQTARLMSYSMNELQMDTAKTWLSKAEAIVVIEPSTQTAGRLLQQLRGKLMELDFKIWAPCTHQEACPMLTHSKTDWCHDRVHVQLPDYFSLLEKHMPIRNQTLSYSYLLMRKSPPRAASNRVRVVSDQLLEKGKTRNLICRNSNREWFSWLQRHGPAPDLYRGDLLEWEGSAEVKGQELRLDPSVKFQSLPLKI